MDINWLLKWSGCTAVILGAVLTCLKLDPINLWFMNLGSVLYLIWGWRLRELNIVIVNAVMVAIFALGLVWRAM